MVFVRDEGNRVGDSLKVRAMGVIATRWVALWAVRRSWKGIIVFVSSDFGYLMLLGSIGGRKGRWLMVVFER